MNTTTVVNTRRVRKDEVLRARRQRCVEYAARLHRRLGKPGTFSFHIVKPRRVTDHKRAERSLWIGFMSAAERKQGIRELAAQGYNYFVCYKDTQCAFALNAGVADWVLPGQVYVDW